MRSKILSVILSICMVLTLTPAMAFAAGDTDISNNVSILSEPVVSDQDGNIIEDFVVTTGGAIDATTVSAIKLSGTIDRPVAGGTRYTIEVEYSVVADEAQGAAVTKTTASGIVVVKATNETADTVTVADQAGTAGKIKFSDKSDPDNVVNFTLDVNVETLKIKPGSTDPDPEEPGTTTPGGIGADEDNAGVIDTTVPAIEVPVDATEEQKDVIDTINNNLGSVKAEADQTEIQTKVNDLIKEDATITDEKKTELADDLTNLSAIVGTVTADDIVFVAEPSLKISVGTVNLDEANGTPSVTWNLDYVYKLIATTADIGSDITNLKTAGSGQNAVYVDDTERKLDTVNVEIEIQLPIDTTQLTFLANKTKAFVKHVKPNNGPKYLHEATIEGSSGVKTLTFKNKYGFSEFTAQAEADGLTIGDAWYETLQEAVDAANSGDTITIHENLPEDQRTATVSGSKNIKFTLDDDLDDVTLKVGGQDIALTPGGEGSFNNVPSGGGGGGGGSSATTYTVTVPSSVDHGKITVSPRNASKGNTVTITATPDEGYKVGTITVKDKDGKEIEVKDAGDNKYTFVMPASKVDITATFVEDDGKEPTDPTDPTEPTTVTYSDVAETAWYYDAVNYVTTNGLMNGVGNDRFAPNSNLTRAMFAQILYNKEGKPAAGASTFSDVAAGQWYTDAISWAAANGVVNGIGNNMFGPNNNITREQLAVMLYRYAGSPAVSGSVTGFNDAGQISSYATTAMAWATTNGVMNGKGDGRLDPKGLATRAEVAQMMQNYFK